MAPPVLENMRVVGAAWRDEWTGVLHLEMPGQTRPTMVYVSKGGLVHASRARGVARGIAVGRVEFHPQPVSGRGDRKMLGRILTAVARAASGRVSGTLPSDAVVELSMPPERLAGCVSPDLVDRLLGRPAVVGALVRDGSATIQELRALGWLGIVRLRRGRTRPRARKPMRGNVPRVGGFAASPPTPNSSMLNPPAIAAVGRPGSAPAPIIGSPDVTHDATPSIDTRPIPLPDLESDHTAGGMPMVHLGMRAPFIPAGQGQRLENFAFGEDQRPDNLPRNLLEPREEDTVELTEESLLSGLDDALADVLTDEEVAVLLGLPGATARARSTESIAPSLPQPASPSSASPEEVAPVLAPPQLMTSHDDDAAEVELALAPALEEAQPAGKGAVKDPIDQPVVRVSEGHFDVSGTMGASGYGLGDLVPRGYKRRNQAKGEPVRKARRRRVGRR